MLSFLIRRIAQGLVVVIGVLIITFILIHLEPGSPARAALGIQATPTSIAHFNKVNGLDQGLLGQFSAYVIRTVHGNLGYSYVENQSVSSLIREALPKDIVLLVPATLIALALGIPIGLYQALKRNTIGDFALQGSAFLLYAMPPFFLGLILVAVFAIAIPLFPPEAPQYTSAFMILKHPLGLVLPILTLSGVSVAAFTQFARSAGIDNLAQDYIRTAHAMGLRPRSVVVRHLLRNSLIPIVTLLGLSLPGIVGGALIVEEVFNYPGMGLLFYQAAVGHDYPVLLGFTLFVGIAAVVGNMVADIVYAALDPRVRLE